MTSIIRCNGNILTEEVLGHECDLRYMRALDTEGRGAIGFLCTRCGMQFVVPETQKTAWWECRSALVEALGKFTREKWLGTYCDGAMHYYAAEEEMIHLVLQPEARDRWLRLKGGEDLFTITVQAGIDENERRSLHENKERPIFH